MANTIANKTSISQRTTNLANFVKAWKRYWPFYVMLLPCIIWYLVFKYAPMYGIVIAFKNYNIAKGIMDSPWAEPFYRHFQYFFNGPYAKQVIGNTLIISAYKIIFGMLPPLLLALLINECRVRWLGRVIQTLTYLPHFLSWVIIYGILIALFSQSTGLVNHMLTEIGMDSIPFLTSPKYFRGVLIASEVWQSAGWGAIIYLSAITGIDPSLYEAARMDGCGRFGCVIHITLPNIKGVFIMLLILRLGSIMNAGFDQIYILASDQVLSVAEILDTWVFKQGLEKMNYSLASAVGLCKSIIGFVLLTGSNRLARRWDQALW